MTHAYLIPPITLETIWPMITVQAQMLQRMEPPLAKLLQDTLLSSSTLQDALAKVLAEKLASPHMDADALYNIITKAHQETPAIAEAAKHDLLAIMSFDPAAHDLLTPFLFFKGFHALQSYRISHHLWVQGRKHLALHFQSRIADVFAVDIHPGARIGRGVMMDHATGIVIGETTVVEDNVLFWHAVTLGGKNLTNADRHPKIRKGASLGAGSILLGNIEISENARIAAGSIVVENVPAGATIASLPSKVIKK